MSKKNRTDKARLVSQKRRTINALRSINGKLTEVAYHYYSGKRPKLFAIANGSVKMSYAGTIAKTIYKRLLDEPQKPQVTSKTKTA